MRSMPYNKRRVSRPPSLLERALPSRTICARSTPHKNGVLETTDRKAVVLVVVVLVHISVAVVEVPVPRVVTIVLRRTPEVSVVTLIVETTIIVAVTSRENREIRNQSIDVPRRSASIVA